MATASSSAALVDASGLFILQTVAKHNDRPLPEHSQTDTLEWLAFRLALLGCEFEVHEPSELTEYVRALGARLTRAAGNTSPTLPGTGCP